jgi:hypothetical protein
LLALQITDHLNSNKLLFNAQYGFRSDHSCESALNEILSSMNTVLSKRLIGLYLFIDFRKAFDLVNSKILLFKLEYGYGFDLNSINLLKNYFENRKQFTKINNVTSNECQVNLGVPQGSVLGPLFFLLFINDLPYYLDSITTVLFADDTTLHVYDSNLESLISKFNNSSIKLIEWCNFNQLDINWSKTKAMFITNKKSIDIPEHIKISQNEVDVVNSFELLGVIIDNKLNFLKYIGELRRAVNKRLYSIKGLFFLSLKVKIQFLKTFLLPHFDYCSSICIYLPKASIQKIANSYNNCIFKLLDTNRVKNTKINSIDDYNIWNNNLEYYGLQAYQHRIIIRLSTYIHKILNNSNSPANLVACFTYNNNLNKKYNLRNLNKLYIPSKGKYNDRFENTFNYFFSKFVNELYSEDLLLGFNLFKIRVINNINCNFLKFIKTFEKFDINFKNYKHIKL